MDREQLSRSLHKEYAHFLKVIAGLDAGEYDRSAVEGKWSPGQHLDHLCRSVEPLTLIFLLPGGFIRLLFGKAKRPSRSFDQLVSRYQEKLRKGGKASGRYVPAKAGLQQKDKTVRKLERLLSRLRQQLGRFQEEELDILVLPHPLLGKLTLREMMYFTIYHAIHHRRLIDV